MKEMRLASAGHFGYSKPELVARRVLLPVARIKRKEKGECQKFSIKILTSKSASSKPSYGGTLTCRKAARYSRGNHGRTTSILATGAPSEKLSELLRRLVT